MHFDLVEQVSVVGSGHSANEDRAGTSANLAWVIDGATDLGPNGLMGNQSGAAWLAAKANAAFSTLAATAADRSMPCLLDRVFESIALSFGAERARGPQGVWELPSAAFLAIRLEADKLVAAWAADCVCLRMRGSAVMRIGDRRSAVERKLAEQIGRLDQDALPLAQLRRQRELPDRAAMVVTRESRRCVQIAHFERQPGDEYVLMSDGFAALIDDYEISPDEFVAQLRSDGLVGLASKLRSIEGADADRRRYSRIKKSDDATAIWLRTSD